jgi:urease accessory protein
MSSHLAFRLARNIAVATPALLVALAAASAAQAHTGTDPVHDLSHGFLHPLTGIDHLLAMIAVGVFAAVKGGRSLWLVPASFIAMMALGGVAALAGLGLPLIELGIVGSLVVFGVAIFFADRIPYGLGMALAGMMAVFHGHAHGAEIGSAAALPYVIGFLAATSLLHAVGVAAAIVATRSAAVVRGRLVRASGVAFGAAGLALLVA